MLTQKFGELGLPLGPTGDGAGAQVVASQAGAAPDAALDHQAARINAAAAAAAVGARDAGPYPARVFPAADLARDDVEEDVRALIASSDRDEVAMNTISGLYRRKYGRMLDYKSLGFAKMTAFVAEIPGLELVNGAAGGSVRLARAAPHRMIYDYETDSELEGYA